MDNQTPDPVVDEVREIRRQIAADFGNDLLKLAHHLREVEKDYAAHRGIFSGITSAAAAEVEKSWGDMSHLPDDRLVQEIREIRKNKRAG